MSVPDATGLVEGRAASTEQRDHLFINYASEDTAFAEWLTLKLSGEGYRVWCDRVKLLGGESYPTDIDRALRERTFRVLAVLSKHSLMKPNPLKERTLALNLSKARGEQLLIPLNLDGTRVSDLPWDLSDLSYIAFDEGWAAGLARVLKKLDALATPKEFTMGRDSVREYVRSRSRLSEVPERLWTNLLLFADLPDALLRLELDDTPAADVLERWPHYFVGPQTLLALEPPPDEVKIRAANDVPWRGVERPSSGPRPVDVLTNLVREYLRRKALDRGLVESSDGRYLYFPAGLVPGNRLTFTTFDGSPGWVASTGERHAWTGSGTEGFRYHLALDFKPVLDRFAVPLVHLRSRVYLTNDTGVPLTGTKLLRRRKLLCKDWWNKEWLWRLYATLAWLSEETDDIVLTHRLTPPVRLRATPMTLSAPAGINEAQADVPAAASDLVPIDETTVPPWLLDEDGASDG